MRARGPHGGRAHQEEGAAVLGLAEIGQFRILVLRCSRQGDSQLVEHKQKELVLGGRYDIDDLQHVDTSR
eukprot:6017062-Alexandrium_andersonii.AAC.1